MKNTPNEINDRLPPKDERAERAILGSMIRRNSIIPEVLAMLTIDAFSMDAHYKLYNAIQTLHDAGRPVDLVTIASILAEKKQLEDVGYVYLAELLDGAPTAENFEHYATIVLGKYQLRQLQQIGYRLVSESTNPSGSPDSIIATAQDEILKIGSTRMHTTRDLADYLDEAYADITRRVEYYRSHGETRGGGVCISTGFKSLDVIAGGWEPGKSIVIGARPSVGKTAFALNLIENAGQQKARTLFISLEQPGIDIAKRMMGGEAATPSDMMQEGSLNDEHLRRIRVARDSLRKLPIRMETWPELNIREIYACALREKAAHGLRILFLDYLGLIKFDNEGRHQKNLCERIAVVTRQLKLMAKKLDISVITLVQVNREVEKRPDRRPRLSDLSDSDSIARDADIVILMHEKFDRAETIGHDYRDIVVDVAKNRDGPTGPVTLSYHKATMRFDDAMPSK